MKRRRGSASASPHSHKHARVEREASKGRSELPTSSFAPPRDHHGVRFTQEVRFSARPAEVIVYDDPGAGPASAAVPPAAPAPPDADWGGDVDGVHTVAHTQAPAVATAMPPALASDDEEIAIVAEADELLRHSRLARAHSPKPTHHSDASPPVPPADAARARSVSDASDGHSVALSDAAFADDEVEHAARPASVARSFFSMADGGSFARSGSVSSASMSDLSEYARAQVRRRRPEALSDGEQAVLEVAIAAGDAQAAAEAAAAVPPVRVRARARHKTTAAPPVAVSVVPMMDAGTRARVHELAQLQGCAALLRRQAAVAEAHAAWIATARAAVDVDVRGFAAAVSRTAACMAAVHSRLRTPRMQREEVQRMFDAEQGAPLLERLMQVINGVQLPPVAAAMQSSGSADRVPLLADPFLAMPYPQTLAPLPVVAPEGARHGDKPDDAGDGDDQVAMHGASQTSDKAVPPIKRAPAR